MFNGMFHGRKELDMREAHERGKALYTLIENEAGASQEVLIQQLPNVLILTPSQYADQKRTFRYLDTDKVTIYKTKHNVMEIEVKE